MKVNDKTFNFITLQTKNNYDHTTNRPICFESFDRKIFAFVQIRNKNIFTFHWCSAD